MGTAPVNKSRIPMECPRCHTPGTVRLAKLHQKIACANCGLKFQVSETGRVLTAAEAKAARQKKAFGAQDLTAWDRAPLWLKVAAPSTVAFILLLGALWFWPTAEPIPSDVVGRTRAVAESVARGFPHTVTAVCLSGTQKDAAEWLNHVRPRAWEKKVTSETPIQIDVKIIFESADRCGTLAIVVPREPESKSIENAQLIVRGDAIRAADTGKEKAIPKPAAAAPTRDPDMALLVYWVKKNGEWVLDGRTTLANSRVGSRDQY